MASQAQAAATDTNESAYLLLPPKKNGPYSPRTLRRKKRLFLKSFASTLSITEAAKAAGVDRGSHYTWLNNDPQYAKEFHDLEERKVEFLEQQVYKRGAVGWEEPVFHQGEVCGHVRRFSDACAIFMLKAARPHIYRERYEVSGPLGALLDGVQVAFVNAANAVKAPEHQQLEAPEQEGDAAPENNTP